MNKLEQLIRNLCPNDIQYKKIGEISTYRRGSFPQPYGSSKWYGGENSMPFVQVADIGNNMQLNNTTKKQISALAQPKSVYAPAGSVVISLQGSIGRIAVTQYDSYIDRTVAIFKDISCELVKKYFVYQLQKIFALKEKSARGSTIKTITKEEFTEFAIPVPPLPIQEEIVRILDKLTEKTDKLISELNIELDERKKQYEYYKRQILLFDNPDTQWVTLGDIGKVSMCKRIMKSETSPNGDIPFYKIGTFGGQANAYISKETFEAYKEKYSYPKKGDILISAAGTIGRTVIFDGQPAYFQDSNIVWIDNDESKLLNCFLNYYYQTQPWQISTGGTISRLYNDNISSAKIPLISKEEQLKIVSIMEKCETVFSNYTNSIKEEITTRKQQYEYYRDKLLTF